MAKTVAEKAKKKEVRTATLVRIEAAYGPIYLVVENRTMHPADVTPEKIDAWEKICVESMGEPHVTFSLTLAAIKDGECCPHGIFTHVRTVEIPMDMDFEKDVHRTKEGIFKMFPEARGK